MRKITKRSAAIITAAVIGVGGAGAAWAFSSWGDGSADVTATTSTIHPLTGSVVLSADGDHLLYPGRTIPATGLSITNSNDYKVVLTGATVTAVSSTNNSTCDADKAAISAGNPNGIVIDKGTHAVTIPDFIKMNTWASPDCANTALKITFALTGNVSNT